MLICPLPRLSELAVGGLATHPVPQQRARVSPGAARVPHMCVYLSLLLGCTKQRRECQ